MFKYILKLFPLIIIIVIVIFISSYFDVQYNLLMKDLVDNTVNGNTIKFKDDALKMLMFIGIFFLGIMIYNVLKSLFIKKAAILVKGNYIKRVYKKNLNEFQNDNNSLYLSSLTNDYEKIETSFFEPFIDLIYSLCNFTVGIILFSIINPIILVIAFGLMLINMVISALSSKPVNKHNLERSKLLDNYTSYIKEILGAFHIIKTNNLEEKVMKDYYDKSKKVQDKGFVIDRIQSFIFAIQNTNFMITFMALLLIIVYLSITGYITFGAVILIAQTSDKLIWPLTRLSESIPKLFSIKSIHKKMETSLKNQFEYPETIAFNGFNESIKFENVKFSYGDNNVLNDVNLEFKKGGKYLIVGPSGGGKSTVLRLFRKYFNPDEGQILVDNIPLKDIKKEDYFSHIANIEQNVFLFEDTIKNNLTLYKDFTNELIYDALHKAGLDDFISSLPNGIDTIIYDNGKNISGGERSRLAIARGLINDAQIIFLDEAFANLDYDKAKEIENSILSLENVTLINVSHVIIKENQEKYDSILVIKNKNAFEL